MAANSRLTIAVHALAWMALAQRRGRELLTSDQVAASVNTNPVIIRRSLGDLRRAGLVDVRHGAGAGWSLARAPQEITLLDVYDAVGQEPVFGAPGAGRDGSRAAGVPTDRARREHLPRPAGTHRRARLRVVRPVPEPGPPQRHLHWLERSDRWQDRVLPSLSAMLASPPQPLRLAPTARSLLR
jgi:DNA-binding IscR family transcriptional regulator